jgi:riboflavin kinase/FMN adenylyltransferase
LRIARGIDDLQAADGRLFVVLGVFDGLHRGHAYLLRALRREAARRSARPTVITFDAHPDEIIAGRAPALLCDPEERLVRLARAGVDLVVVVHFDARVRTTPYDEFVGSIAERVQLAGFLMTPDAAFGYERRGTVEAIGALGASMTPPFDVAVVPTLTLDGRPVSSALVREAIAAGDLATARRLLGRLVAVTGDVDRPTGRVRFEMPVALPPDGVYRVGVEPAWSLDGPQLARPVQRRATVADGSIAVRSSPGWSHGKRVRISFRDRLG